MDRGRDGAVRAMVVVRAYLTPQGDRVVDLQDGPNVYRAAPVVDGVGGAQSFLSLPVVDGSSTGTGSLAVVAFTQGLAPRPVVLGFLPASQSRAGFTSEAQAAQGVPAFASLQAGELRVAGGRVGVGENGAPFVDSTLSGAGVNVAVADGQRLRLTLATRAQDGSLVDAAPVSEAVPLGLAQQAWMNAELVGKINDLAAQMAIVRAALTGLGVVLPPWTWTPATPPGPDLLSDAVDLSSKARG